MLEIVIFELQNILHMKYGKAKSSRPEGMSKERMAQISGNLKKAVDKSKEVKLQRTPVMTIKKTLSPLKKKK